VLASSHMGGKGGPDVWQSAHASATNTWGPLDESNEGTIDDAMNQLDSEISANGLDLYFAYGGTQVIELATRTDTTMSFGTPAPIAAIANAASQADPTVSPDERVIVYSSERTDIAFAGTNLWYATRDDPTQPFGTPQPVPDLNADANEGDPHLSADGCRIYFASDAPGNYDIYVAAMM